MGWTVIETNVSAPLTSFHCFSALRPLIPPPSFFPSIRGAARKALPSARVYLPTLTGNFLPRRPDILGDWDVVGFGDESVGWYAGALAVVVRLVVGSPPSKQASSKLRAIPEVGVSSADDWPAVLWLEMFTSDGGLIIATGE